MAASRDRVHPFTGTTSPAVPASDLVPRAFGHHGERCAVLSLSRFRVCGCRLDRTAERRCSAPKALPGAVRNHFAYAGRFRADRPATRVTDRRMSEPEVPPSVRGAIATSHAPYYLVLHARGRRIRVSDGPCNPCAYASSAEVRALRPSHPGDDECEIVARAPAKASSTRVTSLCPLSPIPGR